MTGLPDDVAVRRQDHNLWCLHTIGPDDLNAAPDFETAVQWAEYHNRKAEEYTVARGMQDDPHWPFVRSVVAVWPWSAEDHAKDLPKSIRACSPPEPQQGSLKPAEDVERLREATEFPAAMELWFSRDLSETQRRHFCNVMGFPGVEANGLALQIRILRHVTAAFAAPSAAIEQAAKVAENTGLPLGASHRQLRKAIAAAIRALTPTPSGEAGKPEDFPAVQNPQAGRNAIESSEALAVGLASQKTQANSNVSEDVSKIARELTYIEQCFVCEGRARMSWPFEVKARDRLIRRGLLRKGWFRYRWTDRGLAVRAHLLENVK